MRPKVHKSELIHSGFFDIYQEHLEHPNGHQSTYTFARMKKAVNILAQDESGLWILIREYRHPTGKVVLGAPGGTLEEGEDPYTAAQRELFEETGYWTDKLQQIGVCHPFPGNTDQLITYFWAPKAIKKGKQKLDPQELIQVELKSDEELRRELKNSPDVDGNLCIALWYKSLI
jgi:ADP-ribose pyrophosphatase